MNTVALAAAGTGHGSDAVPHILLALAFVLVAAKLAGEIMERLGQPAVLGELLVGIALPGVDQVRRDLDPFFRRDKAGLMARFIAEHRGPSGRVYWRGQLAQAPPDPVLMREDEFFNLFHLAEPTLYWFSNTPVAVFRGGDPESWLVRQGGDGYALVQSLVIRPSAENVRVDWRVQDGGDSDFRIVDVIVEGLSMAATQRDEFASVIQSKGGKVAGLLEVLRAKVGQGG